MLQHATVLSTAGGGRDQAVPEAQPSRAVEKLWRDSVHMAPDGRSDMCWCSGGESFELASFGLLCVHDAPNPRCILGAE